MTLTLTPIPETVETVRARRRELVETAARDTLLFFPGTEPDALLTVLDRAVPGFGPVTDEDLDWVRAIAAECRNGLPVTFTVSCAMLSRWVPQFLGMLKQMQRLGSISSSREITFYADGDGDFRPRFSWADDLPAPANGIGGTKGSVLFDAG